jgi:FMN phosphatase YigB (HAD superfamily)
MNKNIEVIAIDLIDTLVERGDDLFVKQCANLLLQNNIEVSASEFYKVFRKRYLEYSLGNYKSDEEFIGVVFAHFDSKYDFNLLLDPIMNIRMECYKPFWDSDEFLDLAHRRFRIILSSNFVDTWARRILSQNRWTKYFSDFVISSSCNYRKPSKFFFQKIIEAAGTEPNKILFVGDSLVNDVYGASLLKIPCLLLQRDKSNFVDNAETVNSLSDLSVNLYLTKK